MRYLVECLSCLKTVWVELIKHNGAGYVGICPECKKLAYSRPQLPEDPEQRLLSRVRAARYIH